MSQVFEQLSIKEDQLTSLSQEVGGLVTATYSYPAGDQVSGRKMAVQIASGQTLGYMPEDFRRYHQYIARIVDVTADPVHSDRMRARIVFPAKLFGGDVSGLLTVLFGKISFAPAIALEAVEGDAQYLKLLSGPRFGFDGIRELVGMDSKRPMLMAILKPGLGPDDSLLAEQFAQLSSAGVHLVKDDEVRVDRTLSEAKIRLEKVLRASDGRALYVTALNGPAFDLRERAVSLQNAGAKAFLVCPYTYGLSVLQSLCSDPQVKVPIFAHPAFTGVLYHGRSGIHPRVSLGTLMRWVGADAVLYPSPYGSIALPKRDALSLHQELLRPQAHLKTSASVPSAGIVPEFVPAIAEDFGSQVVVNAGTGMAKSGHDVSVGAKAFLSEITRCFMGNS